MAPRLGAVILALGLTALAATLPRAESAALAAGLDAAGEATAQEATRLYRQGLYEEAAQLFAKLVAGYPDMPIFERNLGACFYYLRRPEPALSNLRNYLAHRRDIPPDDKAVVDRWIDEMERLRAQNAAAAAVALAPPLAPALDLSAQPAASQSLATTKPIYQTWWFWTGAAVVVAGAVTAAILLSGDGGSNVPTTPLGHEGAFR